MNNQEVLAYFRSLSQSDQGSLLNQMLTAHVEHDIEQSQLNRREMLNNKQGCCAHCGHLKYVKFGMDKGAQRYKCKSCHRSFTEYTGTWLSGIHKKDKLNAYIKLMQEEKSLDKIKEELKINKKTAFDWRHKILAAVEGCKEGVFTGITESDETFFLHSQKGQDVKDRSARKRGGRSSKKGINDDHVAVIVTQDRSTELDLTVATRGRLKKTDLENALGNRISNQTILCSDSHVSYKGFAIDNQLEHHPLRSDLKQRVKNGVYHIQHVNATHNKLKKWIDEKFWGVSTKYLQNYLNWYRVKELLKNEVNPVSAFMKLSVVDINANSRFRRIDQKYDQLNNAILN